MGIILFVSPANSDDKVVKSKNIPHVNLSKHKIKYINFNQKRLLRCPHNRKGIIKKQ